jgi:hypothetical protein
MYQRATINDYLDNLRWHLGKVDEQTRAAVAKGKAEAAARGTLRSGNTYLLIAKEARKGFETGIEKALGELKRAARITELDRTQLRELTVQALMNFAPQMKALLDDSGIGPIPGNIINQDKGSFDQHLLFVIRQFDVGFFQPAEPETPGVHNAINVGSMIGSTIQQGSPAATQTAQITLNVHLARTALAELESALSNANLSHTVRDEMLADVRTIGAQLSKPTPSTSIVREAGRSLRNVVEGVAAGALTQPFITAATALWSALGLG